MENIYDIVSNGTISNIMERDAPICKWEVRNKQVCVVYYRLVLR